MRKELFPEKGIPLLSRCGMSFFSSLGLSARNSATVREQIPSLMTGYLTETPGMYVRGFSPADSAQTLPAPADVQLTAAFNLNKI